MAYCLHCNSNDKDEATAEFKTELLRDGWIDVLQGLQEKLKHLRENLHRKRTDN